MLCHHEPWFLTAHHYANAAEFSFTYKFPRATFEPEVFIMEWFGLISSVVAVAGAAASVFRHLERLTI